MSFGTSHTRELAARESDGVHVRLLWHPLENTVSVSVEDTHVDERFHLAIAPDQALDAFYHPYAYRHAESNTAADRRAAIGSTVRELS